MMKNHFINNPHVKSHGSAVEIKDLYMWFFDIFLYARNINVSELNLNTDCYNAVTLCTDKSLHSSCSNRGGKVNIEIPLTFRLPQQTLRQL